MHRMEVDKEQEKRQPMQCESLVSGSCPWLAYFHGKRGKGQTVFSLLENRIEVKNIDEMRGKRIAACTHGWLVLVDNKDDIEDCFLLNPMSMQKIQLPPWVSKFIYSRCVLSLPPDNPECIVMFIGLKYGILFFMFCKPGDTEWTRQDLDIPDDRLAATGFCSGKIYMLTLYEKLYEVKIEHPNNAVSLSDLEVDYTSFWGISWGTAVETYLVEISGQFFRVDQSFLGNDVIDIRVFKLDFDKKVWVRVERMEDQAIFLGWFGQVLAYSTKESSRIRGNTIYFTVQYDRSLYMYDLDSNSLGVYLPCPNVKPECFEPDWILPLHDKDK